MVLRFVLDRRGVGSRALVHVELARGRRDLRCIGLFFGHQDFEKLFPFWVKRPANRPPSGEGTG